MNSAETLAKLSTELRKLAELRTRAYSELHAAGMQELAAAADISIADSPAWTYLHEHLCTDDERMHTAIMQCACIAAHAPIEDTVMIYGPTGVGKETFARALSGTRPFVGINCTSLPDYLIESELFGHTRGAFTGAVADREGMFLAAKDGVILIDEIGDMPAHLQPKLLRAVQERRVRPVGANIEVPIRCRIVTATHVDLFDATLRGEFRPDLYWRLATYVIDVPPLHTRPGDVELWLHKYAPDMMHLKDRKFTFGNYRELQAIVKRERLRKTVEAAGMEIANRRKSQQKISS